MQKAPLPALTTGTFWDSLAALRAQMVVVFGMRAQREPSSVLGTVARPPLVVVEL